MPGIFISHSSEDAQIVRLFADLLKNGIGLSDQQLFCTSVPGQIPPGADFKAQIKERLNASSLLLPIISEAFSSSPFCMFELGASWAESKRIIPIVVPPLTYSDMAPVLLDTQAIRIENEGELSLLREEAARLLDVKPKSKSAWTARAKKFLSDLRHLLPRAEVWIYALRSIRPEATHEVIGCFQIHRIPNRPNVITAAGRAYWVRPILSVRGEWATEEAVARRDRILLNYTMKSPPDGETLHLTKPVTHEGIINLFRRSDFAPIHGDVCFSGYVHDLFEWRDNTPRIYAERVGATWDAAIQLIEASGVQLYEQLSKRLGPK